MVVEVYRRSADKPLDDRCTGNIKPRLHDTTRCQTGLTTGCIMYTNTQPAVKPVWQPVWQTAVTCIQPVVKPVWQTRFDNRLNKQWLFVQHGCQQWLSNRWQPVVSCKRGFRVRLKLSLGSYNQHKSYCYWQGLQSPGLEVNGNIRDRGEARGQVQFAGWTDMEVFPGYAAGG